MNRDFVEMLRALSAQNAEFLVIGAHAVAAHGYTRGTKDIDIWIRPAKENAARVWLALAAFGGDSMGPRDLSRGKFALATPLFSNGKSRQYERCVRKAADGPISRKSIVKDGLQSRRALPPVRAGTAPLAVHARRTLDPASILIIGSSVKEAGTPADAQAPRSSPPFPSGSARHRR